MKDLAKMLQVSIVSYAVGGAFLGLAYFDLPCHLISLIIILTVILKNEKKTTIKDETIEKKREPNENKTKNKNQYDNFKLLQ